MNRRQRRVRRSRRKLGIDRAEHMLRQVELAAEKRESLARRDEQRGTNRNGSLLRQRRFTTRHFSTAGKGIVGHRSGW